VESPGCHALVYLFFPLFLFSHFQEMKSWTIPPAGALMVVFSTLMVVFMLATLSLKQMSPMVLLAARETQLHILTAHEVIRALICTLSPYPKYAL
jgi:hypothetical protein